MDVEELQNYLSRLYVARRVDADGGINPDYVALRGSEAPVYPRFNTRSRRGELNQVLDYDTAYGDSRNERARRMRNGIVPRTVRPEEDPETPEAWLQFYVDRQSFDQSMDTGNGIVDVRSQKHNVRDRQSQELFKGIDLRNVAPFNRIVPYYVTLVNFTASQCTCPDHLRREVTCKHMKLVQYHVRRQRRRQETDQQRLERRLRRMGIDQRNLRRAMRRRERNISTMNSLFDNKKRYDDFA